MSSIERTYGALERPLDGSKRAFSRASRGGGRTTTPVAPGAPKRRGAVGDGVWAPVLLKALGIGAGMLALAAIGASSIARGSGVAAPKASAPAAPISTAGLAAGAALGAGNEPPSRAKGAQTGGTPEQATPDAGAPDAPSGITADGKVILNRANADELRTLPGIGKKRALAIVELRTRLGGRFKRTSDLLRLKGIGPKGLRKIQARAVLDAP